MKLLFQEKVVMNKQPLVSIIVPTYNRPDMLIHALETIVSQDYNNWEAIVINDAGQDVEQIAKSVDPAGRVVYFTHKHNKGLPAARNTGLHNSSGEIICYLDDDDEYLACHLSTVVNAFAIRKELVVYTDAGYIFKKQSAGQDTVMGIDQRYKDMEFSRSTLLANNYIPVNSIAHKRELLELGGYFNESFTAFEDWELWLRYSQYTDFYHIKQRTVNVVQSESQSSMLFREKKRYPALLERLFAMYPTNVTEINNARNLVMLNSRAELAALKMSGVSEEVQNESDQYQDWIELHRLSQMDVDLMLRRIESAVIKPGIHIIVILKNINTLVLANIMSSLSVQIYEEWGLSIFSLDPSPENDLTQLDMVEWVRYDENNLNQKINQEVDRVGADWICFHPDDVTLETHALLKCTDYILHNPDWKYVYADHDVINEKDERLNPYFKPHFDIDLLRSVNYIGLFALIERRAFEEVGGYQGYSELTNYDLAFKTAWQYGNAAIGNIEDVLFHVPLDNNDDEELQKSIMQADFAKRGLDAEIKRGLYPGSFCINYKHQLTPMVSIILPTRNLLEYIQPCIDTILARTDYSAFEIIIIDHDSDDPDVRDYLVRVIESNPGKIQLLRWSDEFNFSAMVNSAIEKSVGDYILLMHNDTLVIQDQWLNRMMNLCQRDDVDIVGARLLSPGDGKIQHAGYVLGKSSIVDSTYANSINVNDMGFQGSAQIIREVTAVSSACMLFSKSIFKTIGGMDHINFPILYNDVDMCLRAREKGARVVWTPFANMLHHGGVSTRAKNRDGITSANRTIRYEQELDTFYKLYTNRLGNDPFYNRNLSLVSNTVEIEHQAVCNWDTSFHDIPRAYGAPLSGGAGEYRIKAPFRMLERMGVCQTDSSTSRKINVQRFLSLPELKRLDPDVIVFHSPIADEPLNALNNYKKYTDTDIILTIDDLVTDLPDDNPFKKIAPRDARSRLREALSYSDRMIVTTEPLRAYCETMIEEIHVIPNYLENEIWEDLGSLRAQSLRPRVGWAGAQQHGGDLAFILDIVKETANEIDWIFFGMCPDEIKSCVAENHEFEKSFVDYARKLASLNLDLAIAPLEVHPFNEAKSNLRLLEYGVFGWPVICTDIYPYQDAPVKCIRNNKQEWLNAIRERIHDLDAAYKEGDVLMQWVRGNHMLNDHVDEWRNAILGTGRN